MRTQKAYPQVVKRFYHRELTHCLECQSRIRRCATISQRTVITLKQVIRVTYCADRCPDTSCPSRRAAADAFDLSGFTFGLDIVLLVGQLRLNKHQTADEIHQELVERLAPFSQTISPPRDPVSL